MEVEFPPCVEIGVGWKRGFCIEIEVDGGEGGVVPPLGVEIEVNEGGGGKSASKSEALLGVEIEANGGANHEEGVRR
jgi:hypothetical protein